MIVTMTAPSDAVAHAPAAVVGDLTLTLDGAGSPMTPRDRGSVVESHLADGQTGWFVQQDSGRPPAAARTKLPRPQRFPEPSVTRIIAGWSSLTVQIR